MSDPISPTLSGWNFAERERKLFDSASEIPTWRLANQSRRFLAAVLHELSNAWPAPTVEKIDDLDPASARELAALELGAVAVRAAGAIIVLIGCGYEREALGQGRVLVEAVIRTRQGGEDLSGQTARKLLKGHRPGSLKSAAARYGQKEEIEVLDRFAHADPVSLLPLADGPVVGGQPREQQRELRAQRGKLRPALQLYTTAYETVSYSALLAEIFGRPVQIPARISGQLKHYREHPLPYPL